MTQPTTGGYSKPPPPSNIDWQRLNGHLLLIKPLAFEANVHTTNGPRDVVRATIGIVDTGEIMQGAAIFPKLIVSQLRDMLGGKVLGRVIQGAAKAGQNPPWVLAEATPQDEQAADRFEELAASGQTRPYAQAPPQNAPQQYAQQAPPAQQQPAYAQQAPPPQYAQPAPQQPQYAQPAPPQGTPAQQTQPAWQNQQPQQGQGQRPW